MSSAGQALKGAAVLFSSRWMPFAVYASFILALSLSAIQEVESGADDTQLAQAAAQDDDGVAMGASGGDLTVSMHISDTHVDLGIPERVAKLNEWATSTVPTVDPAFVLHSGDLTEGYATFLGSEQQEPEWRAYKELIALAGLNKTTRYADVRGNHDTAMVNSLDAANNYYRKYGLWGPKIAGTDAERVFQAEFNTSHGMYRAVFVDLAPIPGPTIPFTNGGSADAEMMARLESLLAQPGPWAATLIVSHYPLTYVVQGGDLLDLASKHRVTAILCGHTHNDDMTANRGDLLELEVGDMKRNFIYRGETPIPPLHLCLPARADLGSPLSRHTNSHGLRPRPLRAHRRPHRAVARGAAHQPKVRRVHPCPRALRADRISLRPARPDSLALACHRSRCTASCIPRTCGRWRGPPAASPPSNSASTASWPAPTRRRPQTSPRSSPAPGLPAPSLPASTHCRYALLPRAPQAQRPRC